MKEHLLLSQANNKLVITNQAKFYIWRISNVQIKSHKVVILKQDIDVYGMMLRIIYNGEEMIHKSFLSFLRSNDTYRHSIEINKTFLNVDLLEIEVLNMPANLNLLVQNYEESHGLL